MQITTPEFDAAVLAGGPFVNRVVITVLGVIMEDTYYLQNCMTLISDASSVAYDRTSDTRMSCDLSFNITNVALSQTFMDETVFPEAQVYCGVLVSGVPQWLSMGVFGLFQFNTSVQGEQVTVQANGTDRSDRLRNNPFKTPWQTPASQDYFTALINIFNDRAKGFTPEYNVGSSAFLTPGAINFDEDSDPFAAGMKLMEAVGCELYFGRYGEVCAFPIPDPLLIAPTMVLHTGDANGVTISPITKNGSNKDVVNGVICRGEAPWLLFPISGEIWDDDPLSPTFRSGSFGEKPKKIGDALASTNAQCLATATAEFNKVKGVAEEIDFQSIKDPRVDIGDVVDILNVNLGVTGRYVLDKYTYPLGFANCTGMIRRKR